VTLAFVVLHLFGVSRVGRAQMVLGGVLLMLLAIYVVAGLVQPQGFSWERFVPGREFFVHDTVGTNIAMILGTSALIFNAFVGFELIADDAEEVSNPNRNIPIALLGSLAGITLIYTLVTLVTLGTVPWPELAGSETALTQAVSRFMPRVGPALMGLAGIIATLTSINTAMLSATREAMTLSRLGLWPRAMARLGRLRTPYVAILFIGAIISLTSALGVVTLLGYISSSGYLFVMFWSGLAMLRLHRLHTDIERPFRAPFFPLTAYVQVVTCVVIVAFTAPAALAFGGGVLLLLTIVYYLRAPLTQRITKHKLVDANGRDRILVAIANPGTADGLVDLAASLSERVPGTMMEILTVSVNPKRRSPRTMMHLTERLKQRENELLNRLQGSLRRRNIPFYTHACAANNIATGIVKEVAGHGDVKLLIMGWPGVRSPERLAGHPVTTVLKEAPTNIAVLLNRDVPKLKRILVPFGGGVHARLALRIASELAEQEDAEVVALRVYCGDGQQESEEVEDELMLVYETIEAEFDEVPASVRAKLVCTESVPAGILAELQNQEYQLVVIGAALARSFGSDLFGATTDRIAEMIPCSTLLVSRYEPAAITWVRRRVKEVVEPTGHAATGQRR
jgi:amino acid transporter/nucleotide-binding universal stress UspA family protein